MVHDDVLVIVLAGGVGERLSPLTKERAKPAVYFGGPYRIIDFALSNCINSGFRRIFIATQYKSLSLNRHVRQGWTVVSEELGEFVEIVILDRHIDQQMAVVAEEKLTIERATDDAVQSEIATLKKGSPVVTNAKLSPEVAKLPGVFTTPDQWNKEALVIDHKLRGELTGEWRKWFTENVIN